jgi:hypothetical protein
VRHVGGMPDINDLVRVSMGDLDDSANDGMPSDVASRVEDLARDPVTEQVLSYAIAAPWFSGDVELPRDLAPCSLQWPTPRGLAKLPVAFQGQETTGNGLRVWQVLVTGEARRDERRHYVRVPWDLPTGIEIRRDLEALAPERRRLLESCGIPNALKDLPATLEAQSLNVSEGGLLCLSEEPALPTHLPLITRFTLNTTAFAIPAHVVWSVVRELPGAIKVESALAFDDPALQGEILRPLLFQAQLKARRSQMI